MRPLTYFAFTLLSVVIQFCVMDFIQEKVELDVENPRTYNETINKQFTNMLKDQTNLSNYRSRNDGYEKIKELSGTKYPNISHNVTITTTELAFTVFDVYDENISTTDGPYTTEPFITSTELDNVTEITLFEKTSTTTRPVTGTKKTTPGDICYCNLLYKQCDINCCCDEECSLVDKQLFDKCKDFSQQKKRHPLACGESSTRVGFGNLLCIAKTNLSEQRAVVKKQVNEVIINDVFLWQNNHKQEENSSFNRNIYRAGAPVWILKNKSIYYLDLPASIVNNYCGVRRKMTFLRNEKINCQVKLKDLEMFRVLKIVEDSLIISVTNNSLNHTIMNCSSLYCTNWTIIYCDQDICVAYNESVHAPNCTETECTNVALKIEYAFYISESKIVNVTIKLYAQKITPIEYVTQEINVKFYIGIPSERVVTLSGNPGYIAGSPLIVSFTETNHTDNFFYSSIEDHYISYADNKGGLCVLTKSIKKEIQFGINKRMTCRIILRPTAATNATESCITIQRNIHKMAAVNRKIHVSPYGNPDNVQDESWLPMELKSEFLYGEYKRSKLQCFNIHTRVSFVFVYADLSDTIDKEGNMLLAVRVDGSADNVTFEADARAAVITVDVNFIKERAARWRRALAGPPHLNLNLPKDFFFPFPSNACCIRECNIVLIFYSFVVKLFFFK